MIVPFVFCMLSDLVPHRFLWAFLLFVTASLTDMLDGYLARKNNLVTDFGILMDPLADKLLVTSALICFVGLGMIPAVVAIIILSREFLVTSIRLVAAPKGRVIPADKWGKSKTICQIDLDQLAAADPVGPLDGHPGQLDGPAQPGTHVADHRAHCIFRRQLPHQEHRPAQGLIPCGGSTGSVLSGQGRFFHDLLARWIVIEC